MEISNRTIVRVLAITVGFFLALALTWRLRLEITLIVTAFFFAVAINPVVEWLQKLLPRPNRPLAVSLVALGLLLFFGLMVSLLVPPLVSQTHVLLRDLPGYVHNLEQNGSVVGRLLSDSEFVRRLQANHNQVLEQIFVSRSSSVLSFVRSFLTGLVYGVTVFALTLFMLLEGRDWLRRFWSVQQAEHRAHRQKLASAMYQIITRYVTVNLLFAVLAGILVGLLLLLTGVPFVAPLSFIVTIMELIPIIGPLVAAVLVVVVAAFHSITVALVLTLFFLIYQHVKGNFLVPLVLAKAIPLSPLTVLLSVILGISLAGILGALIAVPVGGCIQVLIKDYLANHQTA